MDFVDLAIKFAVPAGGAIIGFVVSAHNQKSKLETLDKEFTKYKLEQEKTHEKAQVELRERLEILQRSLNSESADIRKELLRQCTGLQKEMEEVERAFLAFERASGASFAKDAELSHFIEDQQRQWQAMHRTLGQIEGVLKSQKRWTPVPPPPHGSLR